VNAINLQQIYQRMRLRTLLRAMAALVLCAVSLHAQTSFWNVTNGNWSSGGNWTPSNPANNGTADVGFNLLITNSSTVDTAWSVNSVDVTLTSGIFSLLGSTTLTVGAGGFTDSSALSTTVDPVLAGTMALNQNGVGTLTLNGANTYSGNTNVSAGILADGGANKFSPNSLFQVGSLGTIDVNNNETVFGLNDFSGAGGTVVIAGGATLFLIGGTTTSFSGTISGPGNLEHDGSATLTLTGNNLYTGTTTIGFGSAIDIGGGGNTGNIASLTVLGLGSIVFDRHNSYTYFGNLLGTISVVKQATGATTLSGSNVYSGATTVNSGTLEAGSTQAFGDSGNSAVTVNGSATLDLHNFNNSIGSLSGGASGTVTLGSATLTIANIFAGATVFSGTITGAPGGSLNMAGNVLDLTGENTYTGGTTITAGTLEVDNVSGGSATGTGAITIFPGATLQLGNGGADVNGFINAAAPITDNGTLTLAHGVTSTFANTITGTGGVFLVDNNAIITLSGGNSYSGPTTVQFGELVAGSGTAFGNGTSALDVVAGGTLFLNTFSDSVGSIAGDSSGTINLGSGFLTTGAANSTTTFAGVIQGSGGLSVVGTGTTILTGHNTLTGPVSIPGTGGILQVGDGATLGATIASASSVLDEGTLVLMPAASDNIFYQNGISGLGAVTIAGTGAGTITLSGSNTYSGLTSVTGGVLTDAAANSFSSASNLLVDTAGTVAVKFSETVGNLQNGVGSGHVSIASGATLSSLGSNYVADFQGVISGSGLFAVTGGVQGLSGNNTYGGGTLVSGIGELFVGSNTAVGTGVLTFNGTATEMSPDANVTLANGIVLDSVLDNDDGGTNNLTLTGQISGPSGITWCTPGALTLTNNGNNFGGGVDMREGTLFFDADHAAGLNTGVITLGSVSALNVMNGVTVSNPLNVTGTTVTLAGNGTIATPVTANSSIVLAPSASPGGGPGNLTFSNGLTVGNGTTINFNIFDANGTSGTGYNLITATGGLNLTASPNTINLDVFTINSVGAAAPAINFNLTNAYSWTFATSTSPIVGFNANQFNVLTTGFLNGTGAGSFSVSGTTNDLTLNFTPVPEPSTWALMGAGALVLASFALRRRRLAAA
jgi:autotransporter-associated beta strand protein